MSFKLLHNYFTMQFNTLLITLDLSGFHPVGGWGGSFPPKTPSFPPKKKERKKKRGKGERERERKREVHGEGRGAYIFLRRIASDQYSLLLHDSIM